MGGLITHFWFVPKSIEDVIDKVSMRVTFLSKNSGSTAWDFIPLRDVAPLLSSLAFPIDCRELEAMFIEFSASVDVEKFSPAVWVKVQL